MRSAYRTRLEVQDRDEHPLREFVIRPELVPSVATSAADEQRVIDTVMQVACGKAETMAGRALHRLRTGKSGGSPDRLRSTDGALAWRCNVQTNSASARRLHYWACPDGTLEFVCVNVHDDFSIPE